MNNKQIIETLNRLCERDNVVLNNKEKVAIAWCVAKLTKGLGVERKQNDTP
jgi:hypothetical protein